MKFKRELLIEVPRNGKLTVPKGEIWKVNFSGSGSSRPVLLNNTIGTPGRNEDGLEGTARATDLPSSGIYVGGMQIKLKDRNASNPEFGGTFYGIAFTAD